MNLLFDLDGTLTDPKEGIVACIRHALECLNRDPDAYPDLERFIGPPLLDSFSELLGSQEDAAVALTHYRKRFASIGLYENRAYDDIEASLEALSRAGYTLFVATSKPAVFAKKIVKHFAIERFFARVYGSELDGRRTDKSELIAHILLQESLDAAKVQMIGDRCFDVVGAKRNGVRAIGVLWGYGSSAELTTAGADALCERPSLLENVIL